MISELNSSFCHLSNVSLGECYVKSLISPPHFFSLPIQEEEREESGDLLSSTSLQNPLLSSTNQCEEDPQAILDEHLSRVLKTPGCQSPGMTRHSPRSSSPDRTGPVVPICHGSTLGGYPLTSKVLMTGRQSTKHIHHHYIHHHHTAPKTKEQIEAEAAQRVQCLCPPAGASYSDFPPT